MLKNVFSILVLCFFSQSIFADQTVIRVTGDNEYLPIIGFENSLPAGILVQKLHQIEKEIGVQFKIELFPWARAAYVAETEDSGIVGFSWNEERAKKYDFTKPLYTDSILVVVKKGKEFKFEKLEDLNGKSIGAQNGASYGNEVDKFLAGGTVKVERDVERANRLLKLLAGRMDVALIGNGIEGFERIVSSNPELLKAKDQLVVLPKTLGEDKLYLAFRKDLKRKKLIEKIDAAILKAKFK